MIPKQDFVDLAVTPGHAGRGDCQWQWYEVFERWINRRTVLDVGSGHGRIKTRLAEWGWSCKVTTQEPCLDCAVDSHEPLSSFATGSFETVTCFDVIEHVKESGRLVYDMARIASRNLVLTTPGFEITKNKNPYHWHEFYPDEICQLIEATGMTFVQAWGYEWIDFDNNLPKPFKNYSRFDLLNNVAIQPIALVYEHAGVHTA